MYLWYFCSFAVKKQQPASCNWDVDDNYTIYMHTVADIVWNGWQVPLVRTILGVTLCIVEPSATFLSTNISGCGPHWWAVGGLWGLNDPINPGRSINVLLQLLSIHLEAEDEPISFWTLEVCTLKTAKAKFWFVPIVEAVFKKLFWLSDKWLSNYCRWMARVATVLPKRANKWDYSHGLLQPDWLLTSARMRQVRWAAAAACSQDVAFVAGGYGEEVGRGRGSAAAG